MLGKKDLYCLLRVRLFKGVKENELSTMLSCLGATIKSYQKDNIILYAEDEVHAVGIILDGNVQVIREDIAGNRMILTELGQADLFAESLACAQVKKSPVSVIAISGCRILFVTFSRIVTTCSSSCVFHNRLITNMIQEVAEKNILLDRRIDILSKRSIRDKLLTYLSAQAQVSGKMQFRIPFNRNELADFICVDRSAMSRELSRMRDEGLLEFHKNLFKLLFPSGLGGIAYE